MVSLSQKPKYNSPHSIFKSMSGFMVWMVWVLIFFAGTIKGNIPHNQLFKTTKAAFTSANNKANLPSNNTDPLQLPEDAELLTSAFDDESDDHKKSIFAISVLHLIIFCQTSEIQLVQSFQYYQSRQQIIAIPLFILHHSWKSHLV